MNYEKRRQRTVLIFVAVIGNGMIRNKKNYASSNTLP